MAHSRRIGVETASTTFVDNDYGDHLASQFVDAFEQAGGEVYHEVAFELGRGPDADLLESALTPPSG